MSRTDKTKPFWVKLAHGDLKTVEVHNHTDGRCDLPRARQGAAFTYGTTQCRRRFVYTGIRTCCCPMCHGLDYPDRTEPQRRRRERRKTKRADRSNWMKDGDG